MTRPLRIVGLATVALYVLASLTFGLAQMAAARVSGSQVPTSALQAFMAICGHAPEDGSGQPASAPLACDACLVMAAGGVAPVLASPLPVRPWSMIVRAATPDLSVATRSVYRPASRGPPPVLG
jgi:hypothetical protein